MSDKNTRHAGQAEEQPLEQSSALPELDHEVLRPSEQGRICLLRLSY